MKTLPAPFHAGLNTWLTIFHKIRPSKFKIFSKYCQMFLIFSPIRILGRLLSAFVDVFLWQKIWCPSTWKERPPNSDNLPILSLSPTILRLSQMLTRVDVLPQELMFPPHAKSSNSFWVPLSWDYPHCWQELNVLTKVLCFHYM